MAKVKSIILLAALFLTANVFPGSQWTAMVAKQASPDALAAELYRQSGRNRSPFFQTRSRARVDQYFEKQLESSTQISFRDNR
ncbi:MAG: hypothetical protein ACR2HX_08215 [Pyrinomonadaceae bacterium]